MYKKSEIIIPDFLRWRPLPAPIDVETASSILPAKEMIPDGPVPCRRCLEFSKIGDRMLLISYDPFLGDSPYRSRSPIFLHLDPECKLQNYDSAGQTLPEQQRSQLLSVRAYDRGHMMSGAAVIEGENVIETLEKMLADEDNEYVHLHYAKQGCFAVRVERSSKKDDSA